MTLMFTPRGLDFPVILTIRAGWCLRSLHCLWFVLFFCHLSFSPLAEASLPWSQELQCYLTRNALL